MKRRFAQAGLLALEPRAFGLDFLFAPPPAPFALQGDVAIVEIQGPIQHHAGWFDSYDAIHDRVAAACASEAGTVVLKIDSPGGEVSGCFDTVQEIRDLAARAGKRLIAYVDGTTTSAAYAIACAAERIIIPAGGRAGSVGVIGAVLDATAADHAMGQRVEVISAGARKADGNPHVQITPDARNAMQLEVDVQARLFFELVSELRGIAVEDVASWQAGVFIGVDAVGHGLADAVMGFDQLLASLASPLAASAATGDSMSYQDAVAALRKAAESDDKEEAAKAKKMLAALEADESDGDGDSSAPPPPKKDGEGDSSAPPPPKKDDESAEEEGERESTMPPPAKKDGEAKAAPTLVKLAAQVNAQSAELDTLKREKLDRERREIFASRPDISETLKKTLKDEHPRRIKAIFAGIERKAPNPAAEAQAAGAATRGEGQGDAGTGRLPPAEKAELDRKMGLVQFSTGVVHEGNKLILGAPVPTKTAATAGKGQ